MRILITVLLAITFYVSETCTQWEQISTIGNYDLRAVKFFNENTGIVAGQGGIWRSTSSGVNWTQVFSGINFNSVSFSDGNVGYSVGDIGKIYKTSNGGMNWNALNSSVVENLNGVWFVNQTTGYVVGQLGRILKTTSSGNSWFTQSSQSYEDLNGIFMLSDAQGYIFGSTTNEVFANTGNGGFNWLYTLNLPNNTIQSASNIPIGTGNVMTVGSNGRIRKSTSYGYTWTFISSGTTQQLNSIQFVDALTGYIAGNLGTILKSTNSGMNWFSQTSSTSSNLRYVHFINSNTGWIVGANGIVLRNGIPVGVISTETSIAKDNVLLQCYPNPFNPSTNIHFHIENQERVAIQLYNIYGQKLSELSNKIYRSGDHFLTFDGSNYPSGIYIIKMVANNTIYHKKIILIK